VSSVAPHLTATKNISLIVYRALDVKNWLQRPPKVEETRPGRCPRCNAAGRPVGGPIGMHGHGLRDRQVRGPLVVGDTATETVIGCRRYRCTTCGAVVTVVPCGIEPRRHYGRAAICMALALWALAGSSALAVRARVGTYQNPLATGWRTLRRWAAAAAAGDWSWCSGAAGLAPRAAAARAAQIAAGRAPPMTSGPIWEQAYAGGAALG
jgi:hypothetical protein